MKKLIIIICLITCHINAQIFSEPILIQENSGAISINSGDFDNDGDKDLFTNKRGDNIISWHENLDGLGNFALPIIIDANNQTSLNQLVVDLDQDGKEDIIVSYFDQDRIVWYRNLGNANFTPGINLATNLQAARGIDAGDIDGDGDLDLVLGVTNGIGFYWIEHLDGNGTFSPLLPISTTLSQARNQVLGDIDGDGDLDLISNSNGSTLLQWYKNTNGEGNFILEQTIETNGSYRIDLFLVDIDYDDDLDIISSGLDAVTWYENLDGLGDFGEKQIINPTSNPTIQYSSLCIADLNNDNFLDVLYFSTINNGVNYQLNDGLGNFSFPLFVAPPANNSAGSYHINDIDGDGDMDVVFRGNEGGANDPKHMFWYRNQTILSKNNFIDNMVQLSPNPVKDIVNITAKIPVDTITIYTTLGQKIKYYTNIKQSIDVSHLTNGVYFVKITAQNGSVIKKLVKE